MFANPKFTRKTAPVFVDHSRFTTEGEDIYKTVLRPSIMNDEDDPPKALIELDTFLVPMYDLKSGDRWKKESYDLTSSVCLTPEDTMKLIRHLNYLITAIFDDHNYLRKQ